jgi:hypothetical protein
MGPPRTELSTETWPLARLEGAAGLIDGPFALLGLFSLLALIRRLARRLGRQRRRDP